MGLLNRLVKNISDKEEKRFSINDEVLKSLDPSIVPLVKLCNDNGIQTFACCSGNINEHVDNDDRSNFGYIAFQDTKRGRELIASFMNSDYVSSCISSAPKEPYDYFGQIIDREKFAIYFENTNGENMPKVYDAVVNILNRQKTSTQNLKIVNSVINKMREQKENFEFSISFNDKLINKHIDKDYSDKITIDEMYVCDDEENVSEPKILLEDVAKVLQVKVGLEFGELYLPRGTSKNVTPILDLISKTALSNKEKYKISRKDARKPYDEAYYEAEYEYCGYEEVSKVDNVAYIDEVELIDLDRKKSVEDDDIMI